MSNIEQLVDEIREIKTQYESEVSTSRRTWPKSIRDRVLKLSSFGIGATEIFRNTGIPKATVELWRKKSSVLKQESSSELVPLLSTEPLGGSFKHLTVREHLNGNGTAQLLNWTVTLPGNVQVQGMDLDSIIELSQRLSQ